jgi:hypothetical protein
VKRVGRFEVVVEDTDRYVSEIPIGGYICNGIKFSLLSRMMLGNLSMLSLFTHMIRE